MYLFILQKVKTKKKHLFEIEIYFKNIWNVSLLNIRSI